MSVPVELVGEPSELLLGGELAAVLVDVLELEALELVCPLLLTEGRGLGHRGLLVLADGPHVVERLLVLVAAQHALLHLQLAYLQREREGGEKGREGGKYTDTEKEASGVKRVFSRGVCVLVPVFRSSASVPASPLEAACLEAPPMRMSPSSSSSSSSSSSCC